MPGIKLNDVIDVQITAVTPEGDGVGYCRDAGEESLKKIFCFGASAGETVKARVTKVSRSYLVARPLRRTVTDKCASYPECGGCSLLHFSYEETLRIKEQFVADCLERIGGCRGFKLSPIIPSPRVSGFRNKTIYRFAVQNGRVISGFFRRGSHEVVDASECNSEHPVSRKIAKAICEIWQSRRLSIYDEQKGTGLLRALMVRVSGNTGKAMVCICINASGFPGKEAVAQSLAEACPEVVSVFINVNRTRGNTIMGDEFKLVRGETVLRDNIGNAVFDIPPEAFFQVNPGAAELLYRKALSFAEQGASPGHAKAPILDIYCGIGTIGTYFAKNSKAFGDILGVEWTPGACAAADSNVRLNGLDVRCRYLPGDAGKVIGDLLEGGPGNADSEAAELLRSAETAVIDPPRKGLDGKMPELLTSLKLKKIVYVSCNPSTLARDAARFRELGWELVEVCPVDMFPFAGHVESIALLQRMSNTQSKEITLDVDMEDYRRIKSEGR